MTLGFPLGGVDNLLTGTRGLLFPIQPMNSCYPADSDKAAQASTIGRKSDQGETHAWFLACLLWDDGRIQIHALASFLAEPDLESFPFLQ